MSKILLVDDDAELLKLNKAALESGGYEVVTAASAHEAEAALDCCPRLVVLDAVMEKINSGFDLAKKINARYPKTPVIMLTGIYEYMSDDWKAAFDHDKKWLPVDRFMEKPVSPAILLYEVNHLVSDAH